MEWRGFWERWEAKTKKKDDLLDGIREFDIIAKGRHLTEDERLRKEEFSGELERFILLEEELEAEVKGL
jgi:hypothetical protein